MKFLIILCGLFLSITVAGQELFVFTEPASNMATKSIGVRLNNFLQRQKASGTINYSVVPELMFGVSKKLMVHGDLFFSRGRKSFGFDGGSVYGKFRFFSVDDVQKHFRMAAFGRFSKIDAPIQAAEINLYGYNSGWESGVVATQLLHRVALASSVSFVQAQNNGKGNNYPDQNGNAINYTLSFGKLLLPKSYTSYRQTNLNLMVEFLNQYNTGAGTYFADVAPSLQVIINSVARVDVGYRKQLKGNLPRNSSNAVLLRLEYNFFNLY